MSIVNTLESLIVTHLESGQLETAEKEIGKSLRDIFVVFINLVSCVIFNYSEIFVERSPILVHIYFFFKKFASLNQLFCLELLTVVTWQKHVKTVLERVSNLCSERDIQLNLMKNKLTYIGGDSLEASSDQM